MNIRFGLYFIPEEGAFYRLGSHVVGYDIRNQKELTCPSFINSAWNESNRQFGFHATITDAITIPEDDLVKVINTTKKLLQCLKPTNRYILTKERTGFWRSESNMAVLLMKPNRNVEMLHDLLVAKLHPLGIGSEYFDNFINDTEHFTPSTSSAIQKTKQYFSPYIFDDFVPHFTCINSYRGSALERQAIESTLKQTFSEIQEVEVNKIALVVQLPGNDFFHIQQEFNLNNYSKL